MNVYVFDLETDGLLDKATRIHCLCWYNLIDGTTGTCTTIDEIRSWLEHADILIGHNIIRFDIPILERFVGPVKAPLVDTLPLSWYLYPQLDVHGLESWGDALGIPKPYIADWGNQSLDDYVHRCSTDVRINVALWKKQKKLLTKIYGEWEEAKKLIAYLSFKMDCAREQERSKWRLDVERCRTALATLEQAKAEKVEQLGQAMPKVPVIAKRTKPAKPYKKDGTLSSAGVKWFALLRRQGLEESFNGTVDEVVGEKKPNPASHVQIKDWLYSLGWEPTTFKYKRDKETGDVKSIPQVNSEDDDGVCTSVKYLFSIEPRLELLDGLSILSHRISILNGFLSDVDDDGYVTASVQGLTNTLRFKHKTVVNLPKTDRLYAEAIRSSLIAPDGYELCGSDMSSLEDRLKQHYIYPYDPEYVEEMNVEGYDPHLSLAKLAGKATAEQIAAYQAGTDKSLKSIRNIFKSGNYACQYGSGPPRLALTAKISLPEAKMVHATYWKKNWAIKKVAEDQRVKTVDGQMWLFNPVSKFWYSLRYEKDRFSTLVQGTASYVFDEWVRIFRSQRSQLTAQFHDEVVLTIRKGFREQAEKLLFGAISQLNDQLQLNRKLDIEVQFGDNYGAIH